MNDLVDDEIHPELVDLQDLIFNPTLEAGLQLHKRIAKILEERDAALAGVSLTDERIDFIADKVVKGMPDGLRGFARTWGWQQFARALLEDCACHYRAKEDA